MASTLIPVWLWVSAYCWLSRKPGSPDGLLLLWLSWRRYPDRRNQALQLQQAWQRGLASISGHLRSHLRRAPSGAGTQPAWLGATYGHTTVWVWMTVVVKRSKTWHCAWVAAIATVRGVPTQSGQSQRRSAAQPGRTRGRVRCDFILKSTERCIGFLQAPDVALVQTPQSFINADPVMRNLALEPWILPDEESFYRWIEPVRDGWGAVVCAGTSFLARREALIQVGGFNEQALSEDFVTGIALREHGWRLVYLQENSAQEWRRIHG